MKGDALSPSLPTLAIEVLFSFLPLLQLPLLQFNVTVDGLTESATDSLQLPTR